MKRLSLSRASNLLKRWWILSGTSESHKSCRALKRAYEKSSETPWRKKAKWSGGHVDSLTLLTMTEAALKEWTEAEEELSMTDESSQEEGLTQAARPASKELSDLCNNWEAKEQTCFTERKSWRTCSKNWARNSFQENVPLSPGA